MMGAHNDIDNHTKDSLKMQSELGHKQITAHIVNGTDFSGMSAEEIELYKSEVFWFYIFIIEIFRPLRRAPTGNGSYVS